MLLFSPCEMRAIRCVSWARSCGEGINNRDCGGRFRGSMAALARYADSDGNFVLVVSGSFEANSTKKLVEIVYDPLIEAIQLGSLVMLKVGVGPVGLK